VALKRACRCVVAFGGYVNCACVPQPFQQLISTMLCPAFFRYFVCQPVCCVPLSIQTFYQNFVLVAEYHLVCWQTLQWVTCLKCDGYCRMLFVANFRRFSAVQTFFKSVKIWQTYREFEGGNFFETQCIILCISYVKTLLW